MSNAPSEPSLPWRPPIGLVLAVVVFFGSQFIAGIAIAIYPLLRHWNTAQANSWLNNSLLAQFFFVLLAEAIILASIYFFLRKRPGGFKTIGLRRPKWTDPLFGLLALPLYLLIFFVSISIVTYFVPHLNINEKQQLGFNNNNVSGFGSLFLTFIALVVLPPIAEEIVFRGLVYSSLKKLISLWPAVIVTSLLFAAGHLSEGGSAGPLYIAAIDTFSLSLVLILLREKTKGLYASMTLHALKNMIAFVSLFALHLT